MTILVPEPVPNPFPEHQGWVMYSEDEVGEPEVIIEEEMAPDDHQGWVMYDDEEAGEELEIDIDEEAGEEPEIIIDEGKIKSINSDSLQS
jgi:hypothetical protein